MSLIVRKLPSAVFSYSLFTKSLDVNHYNNNQDYHLVDNPIYFGTDEADGPLFCATTVAFGSI